MVINAKGIVKGGVIVPEEGVHLPDGARVNFSAEVGEVDSGSSLGEEMKKFAGTVKGGPRDLSRNHDHYLYGTPKK